MCCCSFYDKDAPIYTMSRFLPPSKVLEANLDNAIVGDGSLIKAGTTVRWVALALTTGCFLAGRPAKLAASCIACIMMVPHDLHVAVADCV